MKNNKKKTKGKKEDRGGFVISEGRKFYFKDFPLCENADIENEQDYYKKGDKNELT